MEELKSNSEIRAEAQSWVRETASVLDSDLSRKRTVLGPFRDPWAHAVTIGELICSGLRWREVVPNPSARLRCLQVAHRNNLLDWPKPGVFVLRVAPENRFLRYSRTDIVEMILRNIGGNTSIGDVLKLENVWAVSIAGEAPLLKEPQLEIAGFVLRPMRQEEILDLPPATTTGPKKAVVASARIDAVAAGILKPSREQIKKHLETGGVLLNYMPVAKSGKGLQPGDVVAVRAAGRFRLEEVGGETRSGRIVVRAEVLNGP